MANCPICNKVFAPMSGKIIDTTKKITICQPCAIEKRKYDADYSDGFVKKSINKYEEWKKQLEKNCKNSDDRNIILRFLTGNLIDEIEGKLEEEKQIERDIESLMMTTGYNFEGYTIKKYLKIISSVTVIGTGMLSETKAAFSDLFGMESNAFEQKLYETKESAQKKLSAQAIQLGANAIIGVDFDYVIFGNNMVSVTANGTAVSIEKKE